VSPALIIPCLLFLLATLNLVFRFVIPLNERARETYINTIHLAVVGYWLLTDWQMWIVLLIVLLYPDIRKSLLSVTEPRQLVVDAVLMYVTGTKMTLDSMGLSKLYMRPSLLFGATALLVVSLVWWTIVDSKKRAKMDAT
jgi:hypothetical protein